MLPYLKAFKSAFKDLKTTLKEDTITKKNHRNQKLKTICNITQKTYDEIRKYNKPTGEVNLDENDIYIDMLHPNKTSYSLLIECFHIARFPKRITNKISELMFNV